MLTESYNRTIINTVVQKLAEANPNSSIFCFELLDSGLWNDFPFIAKELRSPNFKTKRLRDFQGYVPLFSAALSSDIPEALK